MNSAFPRLIMLGNLPLICAILLLSGCQTSRSPVSDRLPSLGHRNWVCVVDAAYPDQIAPGVVTLATGLDHTHLLRTVLADIASQNHVKPVVVIDRELDAVAESDAPGINAFRHELPGLLGKLPVERKPHEDIIHDLDRAGNLVRVVILKSTGVLPYSSVFLRLECGYWTADAENRLRQSLAKP